MNIFKMTIAELKQVIIKTDCAIEAKKIQQEIRYKTYHEPKGLPRDILSCVLKGI